MVEFLLVVWQGAKGLRRQFEIHPGYRHLPTLILRHQTGVRPKLVCGKLTHSPQASMRG
jgi:hypothetical protein